MAGWSSMRVLLPSWRFFDTVAAPLALWVVDEAGAREVAWGKPHGALFVNPEGSTSLLAYSALERLIDELSDDASEPEERVSYLLVQQLAEAATTATRFYFEIRDAHTNALVLRSAEHTR